MFSSIPAGFRGIKEWGSPIFILCATSNIIQIDVTGNQISARMIIECTEKDDYWRYRISSDHYLPLLYVHAVAPEGMRDGRFDPILLMKPSPLVPTWLGTGRSFDFNSATDLFLTNWFYLNPCLRPCPLCFRSTLHFAKQSGLHLFHRCSPFSGKAARGTELWIASQLRLNPSPGPGSRVLAKTEIKSTFIFPWISRLARNTDAVNF